ncbi:protein-vacuolar targeting-related protein [Phaffia rhodozyma]|uniref:Protein-vacuolar targeting-related protein n=1 Tax=Phaffia rhodozyma TaxID=264483 RepID=A0A0F7SLP7_PHARH|nr:protein-vacuolar targeting-related protein [Phaffia rhodozyma]
MSSGLSRRRGAPQSSTYDDEDSTAGSPTDASRSSSTGPSSNLHERGGNRVNQSSRLVPSTAGGSMEGRGKIAFDPRDFEDGGESKEVPKLTLLEEVLLLGLKDNQGYTSWFNDNISYALRGCIILELALRRRIAMVKDPSRRRLPLGDRLIEVIDDRQTGETILDEALKMMKSSEKYGVAAWVDLMSGETWNVMKIGYQLKQVRERLAKGLVDKGVLRTEKRNFLLFDMATHPVADAKVKEDVMRRTLYFLTTKTSALPRESRLPADVKYRTTRAVCLCCAAYAANVLENALLRLDYDAREAAFARCDDVLAEFCTWPFGVMGVTGGGLGSNGSGVPVGGVAGGGGRRKQSSQSGANQKEIISEMVREVKREMSTGAQVSDGPGGGEGAAIEDLSFEVVATVLEVFSRMDSLL